MFNKLIAESFTILPVHTLDRLLAEAGPVLGVPTQLLT
jgi:hypothetical protein